jgi:hypothetical protein
VFLPRQPDLLVPWRDVDPVAGHEAVRGEGALAGGASRRGIQRCFAGAAFRLAGPGQSVRARSPMGTESAHLSAAGGLFLAQPKREIGT